MPLLPRVFPHLTGAAAALVLALSATAPAFSQSAASVDVRLGDLDLNNQDGASQAYERLRAAARRACRTEHQFGANSIAAIRTCARSALSQSVAQLNAPLLTALHTEQTAQRRLANLAPSTPS